MTGLRFLKWGVAAASLLALGACDDDGRLSRNSRHYTPVPTEMIAKMSEIGATKHSPILLRAYKQESELEVWKMNASGEYVLLKTYPMCRWSGQLGPKMREGDRQVPEGFYTITEGQLNPNSSFYLSFNVGYPNAYDKANGRTGALIMVHGACSSAGCFSMTDKQIAEIYAITREAFAGGQKAIQLQSYPFRFNAQNMAKYRADPHMPFWKMLKEGADSFEVSKRETQVSVCERKYVFNRSACAPAEANSTIVAAVAAKARADEQKVAELVAAGTQPVRRVYKDGDQHHSFKHTQYADASADGRVIAMPGSGPSRVADVSRPDALVDSATEIPVGSVGDKTPAKQVAAKTGTTKAGATPAAPAVAAAAAVSTPTATGEQTAASATPASTTAFAGTSAGSGATSLFGRLLGRGDSGLDAVTVVEPASPQPVNSPLPPKPPIRSSDASQLRGLNAQLPTAR